MSAEPQTRKVDGWVQALNAYLIEAEAERFCYGTFDCCLFSANGARAMTHGWDPMADVRGKYSTEREAWRLIASAGGLAQLVTERMGLPLATPRLAQRGDVLLVEHGGEELLALCLGPVWTAAGVNGRVNGPMTQAIAAWRV